MKNITLLLLVFLSVFYFKPCEGQLLKKLKDKVDKAADKALNKNESSQTSTGNNTTTNDESGKPVNKGGAGLTNTTPPDVNQQIDDAEKAHDAGKYSDARYSLQQALTGIEIQLGRALLKSLPDPVDNLPMDTTQDKVMSTQWGWSNLTIQRVYTDKKDKQVTVTIGNNGIYSGLVNMYFNNAYAMQADANKQNVKQTKVKDNKAIITYDESTGYTLIVPLGQTSMIAWECVNFKDENEVMNAANVFDIDGIKKMLGEQ